MQPSLRFSPRPGLSGAAREPLAGGAVITTPPPRAEAEPSSAAEEGFVFSGRGLGSRQVRLRAAGASWRDPAREHAARAAPLRFRGSESMRRGSEP